MKSSPSLLGDERPPQPGGGGTRQLTCLLCGRLLGSLIEYHHSVPKSRGARDTEPVHPICHRTIHADLGNKELERNYTSAEAVRSHPEIASFIEWVRTKDPDFHAPTRRRTG